MQHEVFEQLDVIDEYDFINDDEYVVNQAGDPWGQHDHGTSVLSLVAGWKEGLFCGVAPGVSVILSKTEDVSQEVPHEEDDFVEGLEWAGVVVPLVLAAAACVVAAEWPVRAGARRLWRRSLPGT